MAFSVPFKTELNKLDCTDNTSSTRLPETLTVGPCSVYYAQNETEAATADNSVYNCCYDETQYFTNWTQDSPFLNNAYFLLSFGTGQKPSPKHLPPCIRVQNPPNTLETGWFHTKSPGRVLRGGASLQVPHILAARLQLKKGTSPICLALQPGREVPPKAFRYNLLRKSQNN